MLKGRPKTPIQACNQEVKAFFRACDDLALSLKEIHATLSERVTRAPSYRTLQEWRRGTHTPKFVPFDEWIKILRKHKRLG